jgi:hypothetical protein
VSLSAEFLRLFTIQQLSNGSVAQFSDRAEVSPVVCLDKITPSKFGLFNGDSAHCAPSKES